MGESGQAQSLLAALDELARSVVANRIARAGGMCSEDAAREAVVEAGRRARQHVAARFAEGARSFANGMDMFDNKDRSHRRDFADWWDSESAEVAARITGVEEPVLASTFENGALTEAKLTEAAVSFARRQGSLEAAAAAEAARDSAGDSRHGSGLLHDLADRWEARASEKPKSNN